MLSSRTMSAGTDSDPSTRHMNSGPRAPWWAWWPLLIAPIGVLACIISHALGQMQWADKPVQEVAAIILTSLALIAGVMKFAVVRHRLYLLFALLGLSVLLRECHWEWTTKFIYITIAALSLWAFAWRERLTPYVNAHPHIKVWLIATAVTYVFSQFIARRGFQHLSPEGSAAAELFEAIYTDTEEVVENLAHFMLLITILLGSWRSETATANDTQPSYDDSR